MVTSCLIGCAHTQNVPCSMRGNLKCRGLLDNICKPQSRKTLKMNVMRHCDLTTKEARVSEDSLQVCPKYFVSGLVGVKDRHDIIAEYGIFIDFIV